MTTATHSSRSHRFYGIPQGCSIFGTANFRHLYAILSITESSDLNWHLSPKQWTLTISVTLLIAFCYVLSLAVASRSLFPTVFEMKEISSHRFACVMLFSTWTARTGSSNSLGTVPALSSRFPGLHTTQASWKAKHPPALWQVNELFALETQNLGSIFLLESIFPTWVFFFNMQQRHSSIH